MKLDLKNLPEWLYVDGTGRLCVSRQSLYKHLKANLKLKISEKGNLYLFEENIYKPITVREFKAIIKSYIPEEIRIEKDWEAVWKEFSTDKPNIRESQFNANENIVGFLNGVLKLDTGKLEKYNEKILLTRLVNCNYCPNQKLDDAPIFKEYLETLCENNQAHMNFLLEYMGGILSNVRGYRFKKMLLLVGSGNTGKTQIRELTMNLLGEEHCVSIDIKKINDRFGSAQLYGKRLAGSGDMSTIDIDEMNIIKNLTGGDKLNAENKGKDGFSYRYDGFLWFNTNELPHFRGDRGVHVYKRFAIIRCNNVVPEEKRDPKLLDKMMSEKDVIASVAIDMFKKAVDRGYEFSESLEMMNGVKDYQIENNSLLLFVNECCFLNVMPDEKVRRAEFNEVYKRWCAANRVLPERDREIGRQLKEFFAIEAQKTNGHFFYPLKIKIEILNEYRKGDELYEFPKYKKW